MPLGYFTDSTPLTPIRNPFNVLVDGVNAVEATIEDRRAIQTFRWADAAERSAQTGMVAGDKGYQEDLKIVWFYDGSNWLPWESPWITFTPSTNITIGTGGSPSNIAKAKFMSGSYRQRGRIVLGSSGFTVPTGPYVGLYTGITVTLVAPTVSNQFMEAGSATLFDTGVAVNKGWVRYSGTNTDRVEILQNAATAGGVAQIGPATPWTWGSADAISYDFIAEIA